MSRYQTELVRVKFPLGVTQLAHGGYLHEPDEEGTTEIPRASLGEVTPHGFVEVTEEDAAKTKKTKK